MSHSQEVPAAELVVHRTEVTDDDLRACGVDLDHDFPGSSASEFKRYPVLSEGGWYMVIKHQPTLASVSREPWHLLGPITLTSSNLHIG
ncbi:hypothetical protein HH308_16035 [Gordonia sp. TBRC 11910]|uniref:Uncharacterized protein n=1 Tax=Gordonia asplenii TaxID=2725283 RepID=A0A848L289_9ACTN|nr:hypothetical protein [Gordonia asplenii]NMO02723.1 hypothetical protein [Gordonia asplenii]